MQKALIFVSRCQNLETEHNTTQFAAKNPDGGFYYTPAAGGIEPGRRNRRRRPAELRLDDLRRAEEHDLRRRRTRRSARQGRLRVDLASTTTSISNPGMGDAGLYYYYHTFAKALDAMGDRPGRGRPTAPSTTGERELLAELARRQQPDGSWVNENSRWLEGDPSLVTGYALLALSYCQPE